MNLSDKVVYLLEAISASDIYRVNLAFEHSNLICNSSIFSSNYPNNPLNKN